MSLFKTPVTTILDIRPHENADRLEIATVFGFNVVVSKGLYKVGDLALYVPIDSILSERVETFIFPPDSKMKLHNRRVRQTRIRSFPSQGMLISMEGVQTLLPGVKLNLDQDYSVELGIVKYEPPVVGEPSIGGLTKKKPKIRQNSQFHKYNGLENVKWFPHLFEEGEEVVIQEKCHGSNARLSKLRAEVPSVSDLNHYAKSLVQYRTSDDLANLTFALNRFVKAKLGLSPAFENRYGSNNVDLTNRSNKGYYGEDVYGNAIKDADGFNKIQNGEIVYGEIIGEGIQKNYSYGHKKPKLLIFDVKIMSDDGSSKWLSPLEVVEYAKERGFDMVPVLYVGPWDKELAYKLTSGASVYCPNQKVREGIVIKSKDGYNTPHSPAGKRALKWINEKYLDDKDNTDNH